MEIPLLDETDQEILMHRDVHFGGNFDIMLDYYENEGVGAMPDFSYERILELKEIQDDLGEDLSQKILPLPAYEQIEAARALYKKLRDVYNHPENEIARLIADLILTEDEEAEKEIDAAIKKGEEIVDPLIHILDSSQFYNPLFPGFGRAPLLAAIALGKIGHPKAIYHLFHALGQEDFFIDEAIISSLVSFGKPAIEFLLKRVVEKPFNKDNESAAIVLSSFPPCDEIKQVALSLLTLDEVQKRKTFATYLSYAAEEPSKQND